MSMPEISETIVYPGGQIKALGDGRIGGYLVRFTTDRDPDMTGEYFTKDSYFGIHDKGTVYYQHGLDETIGRRRLAVSNHKTDDFGVWAETQLAIRDKYEKFIYMMAEKGMLGWSSGTANHLIEREERGKAVWLKSWPLGLDDTLTPHPAEPRNQAVALKAWKAIEVPGMEDFTLTIVDRVRITNAELQELLSDIRGLVNHDRPLSETKRKELTELLEMFSGFDAVRQEFANVLTPPPMNASLVTMRKLASKRKLLENILQEKPNGYDSSRSPQ